MRNIENLNLYCGALGNQACDVGTRWKVSCYHLWRRRYRQRCERDHDGKLSVAGRGLLILIWRFYALSVSKQFKSYDSETLYLAVRAGT